ncbi:hypothetical protein TrLO_g12000 [Triparma laevis f. longispina]|uniref:Uncharacterized protein n=1 Tax=Triparma laevis f. longispina TaxID=1714387 RepID=A0A9W7CAR2_9STRA|nr:hypothetical protein TrLO_g12000 [Triparma laevis f. longispina]
MPKRAASDLSICQDTPDTTSNSNNDLGGDAKSASSILLVASKDESRGIPDDSYLHLSLERLLPPNSSLTCCLWDSMPSDWRSRRCVPAHGATEGLTIFLKSLAIAVPHLAADYELMLWIAHKRYLLDLHGSLVPTVPTLLTVDVELTKPGDVKREMERRGWVDAVLKPACGTRCEGVIRLSTKGWSLGTAMEVTRLLADSEGDCLLQPFLGPCRQNTLHWGEVCVVFVNGSIIHAVHKSPSKWGWHREHCPCASRGAALAGAECECDSLGAESKISSSTKKIKEVNEDTETTTADETDVAPVQVLPLPLPEAMYFPALAAAAALPRSDELMLFRVDLLPRFNSVGKLEWLVSEVEGQWCQCFLRAGFEAGGGQADAIAAAFVERLERRTGAS